jgi:NADH dehydrogenase/NADH:ubiquinone oxidoreductase subunit G
MTNKTNKTNANAKTTFDIKTVKKNDMVTMLKTILEQPITLSDGLREEIEKALKKVQATSKAVFESLILSVKAEIEAAEKAAKKVVNINSKKAVAAENSLKKSDKKKSDKKVEPKKEETKEEVEEEKPNKVKKSLKKKSEKSAEKTSEKTSKEKTPLFSDIYTDEDGTVYKRIKEEMTVKRLLDATEKGYNILVMLKKFTRTKVKRLYGMFKPKGNEFENDTDIFNPLFFRTDNAAVYMYSIFTECFGVFINDDFQFDDGKDYGLYMNEVPCAIYWCKAEK